MLINRIIGAFAFRKNRLAAILSGVTFAPPVLLILFLWIASLIGPRLG